VFVQKDVLDEEDAMAVRDLVTVVSEARFAIVLVVTAEVGDQYAFGRRLREVYAFDVVALGRDDVLDIVGRKNRIRALVRPHPEAGSIL
jgi:hypothetical protein